MDNKARIIISAVNRITAPLGKMQRQIASFSKRSRAHMAGATQAGRRFRSSLGAIAGSFAVIGGAGYAAAHALDRFTSKGDDIAKTADKLGVSIAGLQEFRYAAERSGMSVGEFDTALQYLVKGAGETAAGVGMAKDVFKALGINVKDADGKLKSAEQLMAEVADAMERVPSATGKATIAYKLFGRSGMGMVNMLRGGSAGLVQLRKEARETGGLLSDEAARQSEVYQDRLLDVKRAFSGVQVGVMSKLLPGVNRFMTQLRGWIILNRKIIVSKLVAFLKNAARAARGFAAGLKNLWGYAQAFWEAVRPLIPGLDTVADRAESMRRVGKALAYLLGGALVVGLLAAAKAMVAFNVALFTNPITWVVAGIAALAGLAYLIYKNWSKTDEWWSNLWFRHAGAVETAVAVIIAPLMLLIKAAVWLWNNWGWLGEQWTEFWSGFGDVAAGAAAWVADALEPLVSWFKDLWKRVLHTFNAHDFIDAGAELIVGLFEGLSSLRGWLLGLPVRLMVKMIRAFAPASWRKAGVKLVRALISGIRSAIPSLSGVVDSALGWLKKTVGIDLNVGVMDVVARKLPGHKGSPARTGAGSSAQAPSGPTMAPPLGAATAGGQADEVASALNRVADALNQKGSVTGRIEVDFKGAPPGTQINVPEFHNNTEIDILPGLTNALDGPF